MRKLYNKTLWVPDVHAPDQDNAALELLREVIRSFKPESLIFLGDFFDCFQMSTYPKTHRKNDAKEDIEIGIDALDLLVRTARRAKSDVKTVFLLGNHEDRLSRLLKANHALSPFIDPKKVFGLDDIGFDVVRPYKGSYIENGVYSTHGFLIRQNVGAGYISKLGYSGVSGHTHRLNERSTTTARASLTWVEAGHLLDESTVCYGHHKDWQQGLAAGYSTTKAGNVRPSPIAIQNGEITSGFLV